ncbi:uncharacterized protein LOC144121654 isoform X2 [Amblyomma americanum]
MSRCTLVLALAVALGVAFVENKLVEVGPSLSVLQPASSSNALLPALQTTTIGRELPPPTMIVIQPPPFSIKLPGITPVVKLVMGGSSKPQDFPGTP